MSSSIKPPNIPETRNFNNIQVTDTAKIGAILVDIVEVQDIVIENVDVVNVDAENIITPTLISNNTSLGFYGTTAILQPTTLISSSTIAGGGGTSIDDDTTFDGYTVAQIVKSLRELGLLS